MIEYAQINSAFENDKCNLVLDDAIPHKTGAYLFLCTRLGEPLTAIGIDADIVVNVKAWCNRARYRCSKIDQIQQLGETPIR